MGRIFGGIALLLALVAAPALAQTAVAVSEPTDFALFASGVIGLLIGRHVSRKRRG